MTDSSTNAIGLFLGRWWTVLLRGVAAVTFGVLMFAWPHLTVAKLILLFGIYALTHGLVSLIAAIANRQKSRSRWLLAFEGVIGIWAGIVTPVALNDGCGAHFLHLGVGVSDGYLEDL